MDADTSQKDMATYVIEVAELNSEVRHDLRGRRALLAVRAVWVVRAVWATKAIIVAVLWTSM